ncbi:hypothetical protein BDW68DRAFT_179169 [Aspergillus falconensis]
MRSLGFALGGSREDVPRPLIIETTRIANVDGEEETRYALPVSEEELQGAVTEALQETIFQGLISSAPSWPPLPNGNCPARSPLPKAQSWVNLQEFERVRLQWAEAESKFSLRDFKGTRPAEWKQTDQPKASSSPGDEGVQIESGSSSTNRWHMPKNLLLALAQELGREYESVLGESGHFTNTDKSLLKVAADQIKKRRPAVEDVDWGDDASTEKDHSDESDDKQPCSIKRNQGR